MESQTKHRDDRGLVWNSQRAGVVFGEGGQEHVGKVDEERTNALLRCVIKPNEQNPTLSTGLSISHIRARTENRHTRSSRVAALLLVL